WYRRAGRPRCGETPGGAPRRIAASDLRRRDRGWRCSSCRSPSRKGWGGRKLGPRAPTPPFQGDFLLLRRLELRPHLSVRSRREFATGLSFPQLVQVVRTGVGRQVAVIRAIVLQELAHLTQAGVQTEPDTNEERIHFPFIGNVFVIRREDRRPPLVV